MCASPWRALLLRSRCARRCASGRIIPRDRRLHAATRLPALGTLAIMLTCRESLSFCESNPRAKTPDELSAIQGARMTNRVDDALTDLLAGKLSRRAFMERATALGL